MMVPLGKQANISLQALNNANVGLGFAALSIKPKTVWQTVSQTFKALETSSNASLKVSLPIGSNYKIQDFSIKNEALTSNTEDIVQVFENGTPLQPAHHPNVGHDSALPESVYFKTANKSLDNLTIMTGPDLTIPQGKTIVGLPISIRVNNFTVNDRVVKTFNSTTGAITVDSTNPLFYTIGSAGIGYFFTGALWMLDSASEWFFDKPNQTLYVATSDGLPPSDRIEYGINFPLGQFSTDAYAVDLINKSNITIQDISIDHVPNAIQTGISNNNNTSSNLIFDNLQINHVIKRGIQGFKANNVKVQNSVFQRTGFEAILLSSSFNTYVGNNDFDQIGVTLDNNRKIISLPTGPIGSISVGDTSVIESNRFSNFNYVGINGNPNSTIQNNAIYDGCLVLNDCGGIYMAFNSIVQHNTIRQLTGNITGGVPSGSGTHSVGIYLDTGSHDNTLDDNTITAVDIGIQVHNSYGNTISNNTIAGARGNQIWLQEDQDALANPLIDKTIRLNTITGNKIFPFSSNSQVKISTTLSQVLSDVKDFATSVDNNVYSTYFAGFVASESAGASIKNDYSFSNWQATTNSNATSRDPNGSVAAPQVNFANGLLGSNLVPNNNFLTDTLGWSKFASNGGTGEVPTFTRIDPCDHPVSGTKCALLSAGANTGANLSSKSFPLVKDTYYLLSFDAKTARSSQTITTLIRQATTPFTLFMSNVYLATSGTTSWRRYSMIFKATGSSPNARFDLISVAPGDTVAITNVSVVPYNTASAPNVPQDAKILTNVTRISQNFDCPSSNTMVCENYQDFPNNTHITWPVTLQPLESLTVYSQALTFQDQDMDGVADTDDLCPNTSINANINAQGCEL